MTPAEKFIKSLAGALSDFNIWWLVKYLLIFGLFLYLAFGMIIIRQVALMGKTLNGGFNFLLRFIAWIHFLVAIGIFLLALAVL